MKNIKGLFGTIFPGQLYDRRYLGISFLLFILPINLGAQSQANKQGNKEIVKVGSTIPTFSLKDQNGKEFDINSVKGKHNLVIYFYPKDETPGCTKEACSFRDKFEVFKAQDAVIIGISGQSVASHLEFASKYHLNFTLLSDEGNNVRKLFGVPTNLGMPGRVTYVVNKQGKVVYVFNSQFNPQKHIDETLRILKELNRAKQ